MSIELKNKLAALKDEIAAIEKALAEAKYPKDGASGYTLCGSGEITKDVFDEYSPCWYDQGNWFATRESAELTRDYRTAVTRINRAIRAGECGDYVPHMNTYSNTWGPAYGNSEVFAFGDKVSIVAIIQSHAADFEAVRKYIEGVLK